MFDFDAAVFFPYKGTLIGGGGIIILKRYRNRIKILKSTILINDPQIVVENNHTIPFFDYLKNLIV